MRMQSSFAHAWQGDRGKANAPTRQQGTIHPANEGARPLECPVNSADFAVSLAGPGPAHQACVLERAAMEIKQVAIVDDDASVRRVILQLSKTLPCTAEAFRSAEDFLSCVPTRFSCLIVDVHMPRVGGIAMLERLSASGISIPSIVLTGRPTDILFKQARDLGVTSVLTKPFRLQDFENALRHALQL